MANKKTPTVESKDGESLFYASERAVRIAQGIDNKVNLMFQGELLPVYPDSTNRELNYLNKLLLDAMKIKKLEAEIAELKSK